MKRRIAVIGGGISGLSVAYSLKKEGMDVTLFEKEEIPGGLIKSERREGYLLERGPNSLLNINAQLDDFCNEIKLDSEKIFQIPESKSRFILKKGKLVPIPRTPKEFILTPLLSLKGKMRAALEPFISPLPYKKVESVSEFVSRRFGSEILDYVVDPLIEGIYAGDPEILSMEATFPRLTVLEEKYGSLLKGFVKRKREEKREKRIDLFSFKNGMGTLPQTLARELAQNIENGIAISTLSQRNLEGRGFVLTGNQRGAERTFEVEDAVLATPAYESATLVAPFSELLSRQLRAIEYAPVAIINLGFPLSALSRPFPGSGCLIPKKEKRRLLGFRLNSNLYAGRAPAGKMVVTCFIGGMRNRGVVEQSESELIQTAFEEISSLLELNRKPEFTHIVRHQKAIPQYDLKHHLKIETISKELDLIPGLYLAGNYFRGVSVWDCLSQGLELGKSISGRAKAGVNKS
jgi:oxygen-dependent protoporphyrinogen oxidase